ncbi:MAG: DUF2812 domain-containing protein [Faecalibacterium sp.]|jgi:hypothetical protein|nr:DUF2812 domain-containing protein [Faecalibacterium sp.]
MRKLKVFWDFASEEAYLHDMAQKGWLLQNYSAFGIYHFVKNAPQELNYKIDYRLFSSTKEFQNYLSLFEDAGWKHICGTKNNGSQYFLPCGPQAGDEIFSDPASAAQRYKTLYQICLTNFSVFIAYLIVIYCSYGGNLSGLGFLTPGLWERTGAAFWGGFFFELPFVILRVGCPVFFAVLAVLYGYWGEKAHQAYRKQAKKEAAQ